MVTNLSNLMNIVAEDERNLNMLLRNLREHTYNITTKELDGTENIIEDCKEDFENEYEEFFKITDRISNIKRNIYIKNNELRLPNGDTIQDALVELNTLRRKLNMLQEFSEYKSINRRVTEVNNSYFEYKTLNFDAKKIKIESKLLEEKIRNIEFEISKLNSIEFEIEI